FVHEQLAGSDVLTCAVAGFPLGASTTEVKASETARAVADGADEIDMVIDIAAARAGERERVEADVRAVAEVAHITHHLLDELPALTRRPSSPNRSTISDRLSPEALMSLERIRRHEEET
ncbi:MAG: hypothetical protein L0G70_06930, partial [Rubrobacter sp.]|nr:hypothetical protein [Rubrobacter sp.]